MSSSSPIGIFDSGIGGLSVLLEINSFLPKENLIYIADSAHCPYGNKPPELIRQRAFYLTDFLIGQGCKAIVVASNTTSIASLDTLRNHFSQPIIGMEPAVKPAVESTSVKKIGVMATSVTLSGDRFTSLIHRYSEGVEVFTQPCPGLVELVEQGDYRSIKAYQLVKDYLTPLLDKGVDTIVLGCTHYPFLKEIIREIAGSDIALIETGSAVARQTNKILCEHNLLNNSTSAGSLQYYTSGSPQLVQKVLRRIVENPQATVNSIEKFSQILIDVNKGDL